MSIHHSNQKYIRYTTLGRNDASMKNNDASMRKVGLFASAYNLRDEGTLTPAALQELQQCLLWFHKHMPLASIDELSDLDQQAICWYKAPNQYKSRDAEDSDLPLICEILIRTEALVTLMQRQGFVVQADRTDRPGVIVYEDEVQVAAIPVAISWNALRLRLLLWRQRNIPRFC